MTRTRILLGIDFTGDNFPSALYTIQQWWRYVTESKNKNDCMLGVSNFCDKDVAFHRVKGLSPARVKEVLSSFIPEQKLVQWTSDIDSILLDAIRVRFQSQPFFSDFNYGSVVNRLLLLAHSHHCDYMVRIDPGTLPPKRASFAYLMTEHEREIDNDACVVVSRRYARRRALRNMFVRSGRGDSHAELVKDCTGIDVKNQITGGAMLTLKSPGTPAMCFPTDSGLTLVWASDDGIYQVLPATQDNSHMLPKHPVPRFDAVGKSKPSPQYYRGIIGAVYLHAMRTGKSADMAEHSAEIFFRELKDNILDAGKCKKIDDNPDWATTFCLANIAPRPFLDAIAAGHKNHSQLLEDWVEICNALKLCLVSRICG